MAKWHCRDGSDTCYGPTASLDLVYGAEHGTIMEQTRRCLMRSAAAHDMEKNTASARLEAVDIGLDPDRVANTVTMESVHMEYWAV